jgi:hypothetical protein
METILETKAGSILQFIHESRSLSQTVKILVMGVIVTRKVEAYTFVALISDQ